MKRILTLAIWTLIAIQPSTLHAQEPPEIEIEFVRQLQAKGWSDLAKIKIDDLLKRNDPLLNATLPLELARINLSSARELDLDGRLALFTATRKLLEDFIAKNQGKAAAALASAELARLTSYHGQVLLTRAMREDDNSSRHASARPAETMFIQASKDLEAAIKALEAAAANPANANLKNVLLDELRRARFDSATNLFNQARTQIDTFRDAVLKERSESMEKSRLAFTALLKDESTEIGWLARAWLMKCAMEQTAGDIELSKHHDAVMKRRDDKDAQAAVRLVRYFHMQDVAPQRDDVEAIGKNIKYAKMKHRDRLNQVQVEGEAWLKAYPGFTKTYEGQGVLFELGLAYYNEAEDIKNEIASEKKKKDPKKVDPKKPDPNKPEITKLDPRVAVIDGLYDKAIKHFDELAAIDGDRSEAGRQISMSIKYRRLDPKKELKTFDEYFMLAMLERDKFRTAAGKLEDPQADKTKVEAERKQHLKNVIKALNSAIALATLKTPISKTDEVQFFLTGAYLAHGDPYRAVIIAESLGRHRPPTKRSPRAAEIAIATYSGLSAKQPENATVRQRLHDMAAYVLLPQNQLTWKSDAVTSMAHYHLAISANRENRAKDAIDHLAQIAPTFTDYLYTQGQLVFIAEAAREKAADKKEKEWYVKAAKDAIQRMPTFSLKNDTSHVIAMYFFAKMEMAKFIYADAMIDFNARDDLKATKKCTELTAYITGLAREFQDVPVDRLTKENRGQIELSMSVMLKYADLVIAEIQFRGDSPERFDQVLKTTKNVVDQTLEKAKAIPTDKTIEMKDYSVTGNILGLALRANVQTGNAKEGKAILDVLKRLTAPGAPVVTANVIGPVLGDIAKQLQRLKEEKSDKYKETKGHYTAFLDELAKAYEGTAADNTTAMMLAQAYTSLEIPAKAAAAYAKVTPPPGLDKKPEKAKIGKDDKEVAREAATLQKWEDDVARYWNARIEYIRALRATKDAEAQKTAEKAIAELMVHPNARFKIQAIMERNHLYEEQQRFREAYLSWKKNIIENPGLKDTSNKEVAKIYFTGYFYYTRTMYKTATLDPKLTPTTRSGLLIGAAKQILAVEFSMSKDGWLIVGPMFQELLQDEPELRKEYERLKALRPKQ